MSFDDMEIGKEKKFLPDQDYFVDQLLNEMVLERICLMMMEVTVGQEEFLLDKMKKQVIEYWTVLS